MRIAWGASLTVPGADRFYDEMRAGRAFALGTLEESLAANTSIIQLFNPAASGIICIIKQIIISARADMRIRMSTHNTALTDDDGAGLNLLFGGTAGASHVRSLTQVAKVGTDFADMDMLSSVPFKWSDTWFGELGEGEGLVIQGEAVNSGFSANFVWIEV